MLLQEYPFEIHSSSSIYGSNYSTRNEEKTVPFLELMVSIKIYGEFTVPSRFRKPSIFRYEFLTMTATQAWCSGKQHLNGAFFHLSCLIFDLCFIDYV
jgi:hypothetical protein